MLGMPKPCRMRSHRSSGGSVRSIVASGGGSSLSSMVGTGSGGDISTTAGPEVVTGGTISSEAAAAAENRQRTKQARLLDSAGLCLNMEPADTKPQCYRRPMPQSIWPSLQVSQFGIACPACRLPAFRLPRRDTSEKNFSIPAGRQILHLPPAAWCRNAARPRQQHRVGRCAGRDWSPVLPQA